jgi:hypothetical protein
MANGRQLVNNLNRYDTGRPSIPRKGNALLQGIVSCGRCARRMCLRYSGPNGDYPVYVCVADRSAVDGQGCSRHKIARVTLMLVAMEPN